MSKAVRLQWKNEPRKAPGLYKINYFYCWLSWEFWRKKVFVVINYVLLGLGGSYWKLAHARHYVWIVTNPYCVKSDFLLLMMNFNCFFFLSRHCVFPPPLLLASSSCSLTECCHSNSCKTSVTNQSVLWIIKNCPSIIKDYCVWSFTVQTLSMMGVSHTVT